MNETEKKFLDLGSKVDRINTKLDDLSEFKVQMLTSARTTAFIVSAVCGGITLIGTVISLVLVFRPHE